MKYALLIFTSLVILGGCGLKGDLTLPAAQNGTDTEQPETESKEQK